MLGEKFDAQTPTLRSSARGYNHMKIVVTLIVIKHCMLLSTLKDIFKNLHRLSIDAKTLVLDRTTQSQRKHSNHMKL